MSSPEAAADEAERRRHYRVDDNIALQVRRVARSEEATTLAASRATRERFALVNILALQREHARPLLSKIERRSREVAAYFKHLEQQIEMVARVLGSNRESADAQPVHAVTLSASGMSFASDGACQAGELLELRMMLFPQRTQLLLYARVVRGTEDAAGAEIAVEFCDLAEDERETLMRHIHAVQLDTLKTD